MLKHPNIVRLYDVIETDKYIGIILDYASGGELFDHILAHRFLKEKDACRLFAQLISGVWYIHQRKIVHRDLKLENLLLDRNRNVIITDFGFANRFEHRPDDLMQTSCGSPCYAAPELVISEGAYVGSAVDIWSCGVILYAMLAGYLPFDDDPANPDGDNINLLYKYIVNTPLSFPDYISREARDLLGIMLQPDPQRRADLKHVMQHAWLAPYAHIFEKSVEDLEAGAIELHKAKRQAYQRQMRNAQAAAEHSKVSRSQSAKNDVFPHASVAVAATRSHAAEDQTLYETSPDLAAASQAQSQSRRGYSSTIVMPTQPSNYVDDDPFAPSEPPPVPIPVASTPTEQQQPQRTRTSPRKDQLPPIPAGSSPVNGAVNGTGSVRSKAASGMRHTIQVEYGQPEPPPAALQPKRDETPKKEPKPSQDSQSTPPLPLTPQRLPAQPQSTPPQQQQQREKHRRTSSLTGPRPAPPSPVVTLLPTHTPKVEPPLVTINSASPPTTPQPQVDEKGSYIATGITGSGSSRKNKHSRGISIDKMGLSKIFGSPNSSEAPHAPQAARAPSEGSAANSLYTTISKISGSTSRRPSTLQVASSPSSSPTVEASATQTSLLSPDNGKKSRRSTLSVMVEPLTRTIKARPGRSSTRDSDAPSREPSSRRSRPTLPTSTSDKEAMLSEKVPHAPDTVGHGMSASSSKARKVMQWFRSRSKGRGLGDDGETSAPLGGKPSVRDAFAVRANDSSSSVNAMQMFPTGVNVEEYAPSRGPIRSYRTASTGAEGAQGVPSFAELVRRHVAPPKGVIRTHHGAVSQATVTTGLPSDVMRHVRDVLEGMGVDVQVESDYKYRCVRAKRRRAPAAPTGIVPGMREPLAAFTLIGSAASNGVSTSFSVMYSYNVNVDLCMRVRYRWTNADSRHPHSRRSVVRRAECSKACLCAVSPHKSLAKPKRPLLR